MTSKAGGFISGVFYAGWIITVEAKAFRRVEPIQVRASPAASHHSSTITGAVAPAPSKKSNKYRPVLNHFENLTRQGQQQGTMPQHLDLAGVAQIMLSAVQGFILQKLLPNQQGNDEVYAATAVSMVNSQRMP